MNRRRALLGVCAAVAVGCVWLAGSLLATVLPVEAVVDSLGNDYLLVAVVAAVGVALSATVLLAGRPGTVRATRPPDPERALSLPVPGDDLDAATTTRTALLPVVGTADRRAIRRRLRTATVQHVMRVRDCQRETADRLVANGVWTDDGAAALYLAADPPLGARAGAVLGSWLRLRPWAQVGARRTAVALVAAAEGTGTVSAGGRVA